jgi:catalase (peroxidase I)
MTIEAKKKRVLEIRRKNLDRKREEDQLLFEMQMECSQDGAHNWRVKKGLRTCRRCLLEEAGLLEETVPEPPVLGGRFVFVLS